MVHVTHQPARIQAYVLGWVLLGVAATLTVVAFMIFLIEFVELSRTLGGRVAIRN